MGLISRVSSRTYRLDSNIQNKMARGARNNQRKKARKIRKAIFKPRQDEALKQITPDLKKLRAELKSQKEADAMNETSSVMEKFDPKTKRDENGHYPEHFSQREMQKYQKINNQIKNKKKVKTRAQAKKEKKVQNTEANRAAAAKAKQEELLQKI